MICPICGKENDDNWPVTVDDDIMDGGCQDCWEKETDESWWEAVKSLGIHWPISELKKSIGIKYYLIFWKRKYYMQREILRRVENEYD